MFDFNTAEVSAPVDSLIPDGTIAPVRMTLRAGGAGEGGWLRPNKDGDKLMLDIELTVTAGPYARRKVWGLMVVSGSEKAEGITRSTLRGILESSRNIRPDDMSDAAKQARCIAGYGDLDGVEFLAKIGIEKGQNGYSDKNKLVAAITPDHRAYASGGAVAPVATPAPAPKPAAPAWGAPPAAAAAKPAGAPAWAAR